MRVGMGGKWEMGNGKCYGILIFYLLIPLCRWVSVDFRVRWSGVGGVDGVKNGDVGYGEGWI